MTLKITETDVKTYLKKNPSFFHNNLELLETLSVPHLSGPAVSLVAKQLEIFRTKHQQVEGQFIELIDIAKENDLTAQRMHELTLATLDSHTLDTLVKNLNEVFNNCFLSDFFTVKVFDEKKHSHPKTAEIFINKDSKEALAFKEVLALNQPQCGKPPINQARILFAENALQIRSCALIPMNFTGLEGIIAIGSREKERYKADMGHLFLTQISEIIATQLIACLNRAYDVPST
ncbi:MAG: DUF484 family protein [Methylococcales bacterium]|jgi:uncharacterized protein YigA (DUF484 family)|nr:DUF484 family protein [Methylococcaceae bacterium]HIL40564.1 DUF484 family protein [Methylococcales bacterium]